MTESPDQPADLLTALAHLCDAALASERAHGARVRHLEGASLASARNLLHYLGVRGLDIRDLQHRLAELGLSSLGRMEAHTLATLEAVRAAAAALAGVPPPVPHPCPVSHAEGAARLQRNSARLLGPAPADRVARIMVTMPSEAAHDPALVQALLTAGMDVMRINCAHDDVQAWRRMVAHLRAAESALGRSCKVLMDLAGPKLRTGDLPRVPRRLRIRPRRDRRGNVISPARVWLTDARSSVVADAPAAAAGTGHTLPLIADGALELQVGDTLWLRDARGKRRSLRVVAASGAAFEAHAERAVHLLRGLPVDLERAGSRGPRLRVGDLGDGSESITLNVGDDLVLTAEPGPGRDARRDASGVVIEPARIGCTLPEVFMHAQVGHRVWLDDGRLGARVEAVCPAELRLRIIRAQPRGTRLGAWKGINLPDTALPLPALTAQDRIDLDTVVQLADMVGMSFVRRPADVVALREALAERGGESLGVLLKIENRDAFEQLPGLLLAGLGAASLGVMVARGDLAVEVGYERLAELQEEILWMAEAAHVPVVWATQVLEQLAHGGTPSRAEVTDAAMSARAECVMLNKGAYVVEAVQFLADVLRRMQHHHAKKTAMLRALAISSTPPGAASTGTDPDRAA